jgi:hypothetical protein
MGATLLKRDTVREASALRKARCAIASYKSYTEPDSRIPDSQSRIPDYQSRIPDYEPPKPSTQNDCGDSPVIKQSLDQLLNNSLSTEQERENFIEFGKKKAASLPTVPALPLEWIRSRFTELFEQWQKQSGVVTNQASNKWENHPQKEEWLHKIRTIGFAVFILESGKFDADRKAFFEWADASNII